MQSEEFLSQLTEIQRADYELTKYLERENVIMQNKKNNQRPGILLAMQRLHIDDTVSLFRNINSEMEKAGMETSFKYLSIPAYHEERTGYYLPISKQTYIAEAGEYLLAGTLSKEVIQRARIENENIFQAQMQQNPIVGDSNLMLATNFAFYGQDELMMKASSVYSIFMTCDTANKTGTANDYSVMSCWGWNGSYLFLLDMIRGKWEILDLTRQFTAFYEKWRYGLKQGYYLSEIIIEDKASGTQLSQWASSFLPASLINPKQRIKDKYSRYVEVGAFIQANKVKIPAFNVIIDGVLDIRESITTPFLNEVTAFSKSDTHKHDDICDTLFDACSKVYSQPDYSKQDILF